jgi:hypothetical protein
MRERVPRGGELGEEAAGDGEVDATEVGGLRLDDEGAGRCARFTWMNLGVTRINPG